MSSFLKVILRYARAIILFLSASIPATSHAAYNVTISGDAEFIDGSGFGDFDEIIRSYGRSITYYANFELNDAIYYPNVNEYFLNYLGKTISVSINGRAIPLLGNDPTTTLYVAKFNGIPLVSMFIDNVTEPRVNDAGFVYGIFQFTPPELNGSLIPDLNNAQALQPFHFVHIGSERGGARYNFHLKQFVLTGDQPSIRTYVPPSPPSAPEPSVWAQLILGFASVGMVLRMRAKRVQA